MFLVIPVFVILMTRFVSFDRGVVIALIALSISPVPPILPGKVTKSGGHPPYGLGLMVIAASFSLVYVPLAVYLIGKYFNRPFTMGSDAVAELIVISILAPLAAGIGFRKVAPTIAGRIARPLGRIAGIVLLAGVLCILAFALPTAWTLIGNGTMIAFAAFVIVGLAAGHFFGGPRSEQQVSLALSTASRHPALALAIAGVNVPEERRVVSAVLLYLVVNALVTIPYVAWQRKRSPGIEVEGANEG
jgi:BASS family bile acid:Na+ symporter